jgi:hypothetical protein
LRGFGKIKIEQLGSRPFLIGFQPIPKAATVFFREEQSMLMKLVLAALSFAEAIGLILVLLAIFLPAAKGRIPIPYLQIERPDGNIKIEIRVNRPRLLPYGVVIFGAALVCLGIIQLVDGFTGIKR